jgi:hypothetical protein
LLLRSQAARDSRYISFNCLHPDHDICRDCLLLNLSFRQTLYAKHDFHVLKTRLNYKLSCFQGTQRHALADLFRAYICRQRSKSRLATGFRFILKQIIHFSRNYLHLQHLSITRLTRSDKPCQVTVRDQIRPSKEDSIVRNLGGSGCRLYNFSLIRDHLGSDPSLVAQDSMFRYVAHVDDVGSLAYSSAQFVRTNIPLYDLFKFLPVSHARKVGFIHHIPAGSRCNMAELLTHVENYSCLRCSSHFTVFSVEMNNNQLLNRRVARCRDQKMKLPVNESTVPKTPIAYEFPPACADTNLVHTILSKACKKMHPDAIEEAGCAVCGELKPVSRLKSVKNLLGILEAPGVTRIERSRPDVQIKEYTGPVLDYTCSRICDSCRKDITSPIYRTRSYNP